MEIQERIHYDAEELIRMTEAALDELKVFQYEPRYRELLGERLINSLADWDKNIRTRKNDPFTLVVCGEFKRGKSSLINALLEEEVVTTDVTTETVTLNRISYGPHSNEAILSGGRRMTLTDEELRRDRLEELILHAPEPITQLELRRPIDLLRDVTIIDTPGLNDSLKDFGPLVERALQQADAVLYLCSVNAPLSRNEQLFLRTMILPQAYTELYIAAYCSDMLREADAERFQNFINQRVAAIMPSQRVVLLSALDELCRIRGGERPNEPLAHALEENFGMFRRKLAQLVQDKKDMLIPDRIHRLACGMGNELRSELDAIEAGLELNTQQARRQVEEQQKQQLLRAEKQERLIEELQTNIEDMCKESGGWIRELMNQMSAEIDQLSDISIEDLTKYYSIYCVDTIQAAVNRCVEYHMEQIYEYLDRVDTEIIRRITVPEKMPSYGFRFALDNKTWTMGDNVGYVASKIPQLGLLSLVVDGVAGAMRQKETGSRTPQLLQAVKSQYPNFCRSAEDTLEATYQKLSERVQQQMADYFQSGMEDEQVRNEQVMRVARQTEENKKEIYAAVTRLKSALERLTAAFQQ